MTKDFQKTLNEVVWGGDKLETTQNEVVANHQGLADYFKQFLAGMRTQHKTFVGELENLAKTTKEKIGAAKGHQDLQRHTDYYRSEMNRQKRAALALGRSVGDLSKKQKELDPDFDAGEGRKRGENLSRWAIGNIDTWRKEATILHQALEKTIKTSEELSRKLEDQKQELDAMRGKDQYQADELERRAKEIQEKADHIADIQNDLLDTQDALSNAYEGMKTQAERGAKTKEGLAEANEELSRIKLKYEAALKRLKQVVGERNIARGERDTEKLRADSAEGRERELIDIIDQMRENQDRIEKEWRAAISNAVRDIKQKSSKERAILAEELRKLHGEYEAAKQEIARLNVELEECRDGEECQADLIANIQQTVAEMEQYKQQVEEMAGKKDQAILRRRQTADNKKVAIVKKTMDDLGVNEEDAIKANKTGKKLQKAIGLDNNEALQWGHRLNVTKNGRMTRGNIIWIKRMRYIMSNTNMDYADALRLNQDIADIMKGENLSFKEAFSKRWHNTTDPYERLAKIIKVSAQEIKDHIDDAEIPGDINKKEDWDVFEEWAGRIKLVMDASVAKWPINTRLQNAVRLERIVRKESKESKIRGFEDLEEFMAKARARGGLDESSHYGSFNLNEYLARAYAVDSRRKPKVVKTNTPWTG